MKNVRWGSDTFSPTSRVSSGFDSRPFFGSSTEPPNSNIPTRFRNLSGIRTRLPLSVRAETDRLWPLELGANQLSQLLQQKDSSKCRTWITIARTANVSTKGRMWKVRMRKGRMYKRSNVKRLHVQKVEHGKVKCTKVKCEKVECEKVECKICRTLEGWMWSGGMWPYPIAHNHVFANLSVYLVTRCDVFVTLCDTLIDFLNVLFQVGTFFKTV